MRGLILWPFYWLAHILAVLLAARIGPGGQASGEDLALSLVDGSVICAHGKGQDWRLHARYDPGQGRFADLVVTTTREAEATARTRICPGRVLIMDRGYARVRNFKAVLAEGGDVITRLSWGSVKLYDAAGNGSMSWLCSPIPASRARLRSGSRAFPAPSVW